MIMWGAKGTAPRVSGFKDRLVCTWAMGSSRPGGLCAQSAFNAGFGSSADALGWEQRGAGSGLPAGLGTRVCPQPVPTATPSRLRLRG